MSSKNIFVFLFVTISLFLSCTSKNNQATSTDSEKKTVSLFIWSNYVSDETLKEFENKYNTKVVVSNFSSNEELLSKLQAGASGYDVIVPTDYMVSIMTKLKLLMPLKKNLIENAHNIDPKFLKFPFDPNNEYSLPYGWTTTGIAVNTKYFKGTIKGWKDLFENKELKGKINLLDDNREVFAAALKANGYSANSLSQPEITKAKEYIQAHKKQIKSYNTEVIEMLSSGEVWASQMYSTDALQAARQNKGLIKYILPEEGCTLGLDNLSIPVNAKNIEGANLLINFLLSKESNMAFVKKIYSGPILLNSKESLPEDIRNNNSLFPDKVTMAKLEMMIDIGELTRFYDQLWTELKSD